MKKSFVVLKFGGTSVASKEKWQVIGQMSKNRLKEGLSPVVVCSAVSGVSDQLESLLKLALQENFSEALKNVIDKHLAILEHMNIKDDHFLREGFQELERLLQGVSLVQEVTPKLHARVMGMGELFSTKLGATYLQSQGLPVAWYDARECLKSEIPANASLWRQYLSATCSYQPDPLLQKKFCEERAQVIITQGFIASNAKKETVLLGRGGSDTSASYFAARLAAVRCEIWTDVPGMYSANPKMIPESRLLKKLHYIEAQEIASTGAKVLHPKCILPCQGAGIPLHIYCTDRPELEGTIITGEHLDVEAGVKSISLKKGITLVSIENFHMWQEVGFLADLFQQFKKHGLSIDLLSTSETNVTVSLDPLSNSYDQETLKRLLADLNQQGEAQLIGPCAVIGLVGQKIRSILPKLAPVFKVFEEQKIYLMTQAASDLNLTFVVNEDQADRLVRQLHSSLFEHTATSAVFGPTWQESFQGGKMERQVGVSSEWWQERREQVLSMAKAGTPLYLYDQKTLKENFMQLKSMQSVDKIFYAIKANHHPDILTTFFHLGAGFECVSRGELQWVMKTFPQIEVSRLLFTPNFGNKEEYRWALQKGVRLTIDNLYPFEHWPELFKDQEVFLRMDPGKGRGHHDHVLTGGTKSKFGISLDDLERLKLLVRKCGVRVVGLHAHAGSGIESTTHWKEMGIFLAALTEHFPQVKTINLGGGFYVPSRPGQRPLDMQEIDQHLLQIKKLYPTFELWLEPGRFLVASAGVLLTQVTQLKIKGSTHYIGVDTGMNSLIRPALYGSYHHIVNLSRWGEAASVTATIVGPICETGDTLGHGRRLPETKEGDVFLIDSTGAYGAVMSSHYNLREPAKELLLEEVADKKKVKNNT